MNWISKVILAASLVHIYLEYYLVFGDGIEIRECKVGCACCKDQICGPNGYFSKDNCYHGCIDGYHGDRCYQKCTHNCTKCAPVDTCTSCYAGYHPGTNNDCTEKCPSSCKSCISSKVCTECKEDFNNANGTENCPFRRCPLQCLCEQGKCVSCTAGYYNTSSECTNKCPSNCVTCSSNGICIVCQDEYYNGYEFDNNNDPLFRDCRHKCRDNCSSCLSYNDCQACVAGRYGSICNRECSIGCEDSLCVIESGNCTCKTNFSGDKCNECEIGKFGSSCENNCSTYCLNQRCDEISGRCVDGCITNTTIGDTCNKCSRGWFGNLCNKTCPKYCKNDTCNKDNGTCQTGCKGNFNGTKCENCIKGYYGEQCTLVCPNNCDDGECYKESGYCVACIGNYDGMKCNNCKAGFYGRSCTENCSSECLNSTCDRAKGQCSFGCKSYYSGDKCCVQSDTCLNCSSTTECSICQPGYFSEECNKICSPNCIDTCDLFKGVCSSCKDNFYGPFCNLSCSMSCKAPQDKHFSRCEQETGHCHTGCVDGAFGLKCNETCYSGCIDKICMQHTGTCTRGCDTPSDDSSCNLSSGQGSKYSPQANITGPVVGGIVGLIVLAATVAGVFFYRRRRMRTDGARTGSVKQSESKSIDEHTYGNIPKKKAKTKQSVNTSSSVVKVGDVVIEELDNDLASNSDTDYYNTEQNNHRVKIENLLQYVTNEHIDSFEGEFTKLNKDLDLTKNCTIAKQPENIALNRYNGIYPYDHSRVTSPDQPDFFINACYIDGYNRRKAYIASLGPTAKTTNTFSTFWNMVWNEKADIIVMLTNLREATGMKCERYWPKMETDTLYGEFDVKCLSIEEFAEYTVRTFRIAKGKEQRNVLQLHYTAWPDKGVPLEVTSLVEFRQRVKAVPLTFDGPIIVHCSAGVGRTGTYIALDQLTEEGKSEGSVDVFNCVNKMREQRVNMVQTAEQYIFLHKSLVHSLSFGCEALTAEQIQGTMYEKGDRMFTKLYKTLRQEVDTENKDEADARQENRRRYKDKTRRQSDVPGDRSRVRLYLSRADGQHDYINAVFINSFRIKNLFIVAQSPLPGTVEDFLSMIYQQSSSCVVALEEPHTHHTDVGKYLPADNETYTFGNYTVTTSKYETKPQYVLKKMSIRNEKGEEKTVSHFQYKNWGNAMKVPDSADTFVQFVKEVENCIRRQTDDSPHIVVHCLNGYERSGLFCVVYKLLEKLEAERQVSVVNTVRKIRTHRKQSITSVEQLKFCYQCISAYMEIYNTYSNFAT